MVDNNESLYREVDEELRREQFAKLWERYGIYILAAAALIVATVGGVKYWESQKLAKAQAAGSEYETGVTLLSSGKKDEAAKALDDIVANGPVGYATLAELSLAGDDLKAGKRPEALAKFEKIAANPKTDRLLAGYASLQAAALRLGEADFTEMENRLKPLATDDSPWRYAAREFLGTAAVKAGKLAEARATLSPLLSDPMLPQGATERIRRLMDTITTAERATGKTAPETKAPETAAPAEAKKP